MKVSFSSSFLLHSPEIIPFSNFVYSYPFHCILQILQLFWVWPCNSQIHITGFCLFILIPSSHHVVPILQLSVFIIVSLCFCFCHSAQKYIGIVYNKGVIPAEFTKITSFLFKLPVYIWPMWQTVEMHYTATVLWLW